MSTVRRLAKEKKVDPSQNLTVSVPTTLLDQIIRVMGETGLSRSGVVQALLLDGLIEYHAETYRRYKAEVLEALESGIPMLPLVGFPYIRGFYYRENHGEIPLSDTPSNILEACSWCLSALETGEFPE